MMKILLTVLALLVAASALLTVLQVLPMSHEWLTAILTAEVAILTIALVWYAARTLSVSSDSLRVFVEPCVGFFVQGSSSLSVEDRDGGWWIPIRTVLINFSVLPVQITRSSNIEIEITKAFFTPTEACDALAITDIAVVRTSLVVRTDNNTLQIWPTLFERKAFLEFCLRRPDRPLGRGKLTLNVQVTLHGVYRDQAFEQSRDVEFRVPLD